MATLKDVAAKAGLSVSAVSRILNEPNFGSPATRENVFKTIEELGYVRNYVAKSMKDGKSRQIALIINDITNPFFSNIARGVEDVCSRHQYTLLLCNTGDDIKRENVYLNLIRGRLCDAFIISVASEQNSLLGSINYKQTPYVMVSRKYQNSEADFVCFDEYNGAYKAVSHLISLGHKRIATLTGLIDSEPGRERHRGYITALSDHNIPVDASLTRYCDFRPESAYQQTACLLELENCPTAIFVANSIMAQGCMQMLTERHIRIPEEMALIAFYEPSWSTIVTPPLTCITASAYDVGHTAAELLFTRLAGEDSPPRRVIIPAELTIRKSCGE